MPTCSAFGCSYKHCRKKTAGKSVHKFPFSRPEVLQQWILNVRRKDWIPSKRSVLCSDHFELDCFDHTGSIIRLKSHAVPTIFNFPQHLKKILKKTEPYYKSCTLKNNNLTSEDLPSRNKENGTCEFETTMTNCRIVKVESLGDAENDMSGFETSITECQINEPVPNQVESLSQTADSAASPIPEFAQQEQMQDSTIRILKQKLVDSNDKVLKCRKKIKVLQQANRRYKRRLETLNSLFESLKQQNFMKLDCLDML